MNSNDVFQLLLCASVLCITNTAGSYSYGHRPLASAKAGRPHLHDTHRRQITDPEVCYDIVARSECTSGYAEDYAYLSFRCSYVIGARHLWKTCQSNSMGNFCVSLEPNFHEFIAACGWYPTNCTRECRDFLNATRTRLGCCVNVLLETVIDYKPQPFDYSLWSLCGLELVTEQCEPPTFDLPTEIDPTCKFFSASTQQLLHSGVLCRAEFIEPLQNTLAATPGCEGFSDEGIRYTCTVNEQGQYCNHLDYLIQSQRDLAIANCDACDSSCITTLNDIASTTGCCFTEQHGSDFWQQCGLTPPGVCEVMFTHGRPRITSGTSAVTLKAPGKIMASAVGLLMLVLMY